MKILCIGHAAYDITLPVTNYPIENTKNRVSSRLENGGGPANNAAYLLGMWGMDTYMCCLVGNDSYGKHIKDELDKVGVNTKYVEFSKDIPTTSSFIMSNTSNGSRTILTYRPNDMKLNKIEFDELFDFILIDGQEVEVSKHAIKKYSNATTIIDAGRDTKEIRELCSMVDYVACSKDFLESVSNIKIDYNNDQTLIDAYNILEKEFNTNIIVTLEASGCMYKKDGNIKIMPSISVNAVDTTGAGDIFHGALTYALANKYSYEDSLRIANITGALSVTKLGSKNSMPSKEIIKEYISEFK